MFVVWRGPRLGRPPCMCGGDACGLFQCSPLPCTQCVRSQQLRPRAMPGRQRSARSTRASRTQKGAARQPWSGSGSQRSARRWGCKQGLGLTPACTQGAMGTLPNCRCCGSTGRISLHGVHMKRLAYPYPAQVLSTKVAGLEAALSAARTEVKGLHEELESSSQVQASLQEQLRGAQHAAELATERARLAAMQLEQVGF